MTAQPIRASKTLAFPIRRHRVAKVRPPFWYQVMASSLSGGSVIAVAVMYFFFIK